MTRITMITPDHAIVTRRPHWLVRWLTGTVESVREAYRELYCGGWVYDGGPEVDEDTQRRLEHERHKMLWGDEFKAFVRGRSERW